MVVSGGGESALVMWFGERAAKAEVTFVEASVRDHRLALSSARI
jgi:hypothetical protein